MDSNTPSGAARHAAFAPLEGGGRAEVVARRLGEAIGLGLLGDGEQLPSEAELAAQLNVATVTLREALSTLRTRGLVETRRGRGGGSFVRSPEEASLDRLRKTLRALSVHELREISDQHKSVAGMAAFLAAERAAPDDIATLGKLVDQLDEAAGPGQRRRADGRFHIEVAAVAQSIRLTRQEIALQAEVGELLWMPSSEAVPHEEAVAEHRQLLRIIDSGEREGAWDAAVGHVGRRIDRLIEFHLRLAAHENV